MTKSPGDAFYVGGELFRLVPMEITEKMAEAAYQHALAEIHRKGGVQAGAGVRILQAGIHARPSVDLGAPKTFMRKRTKEEIAVLLYNACARIQELETRVDRDWAEALVERDKWRAKCQTAQKELAEAQGQLAECKRRHDYTKQKLDEAVHRGDLLQVDLTQKKFELSQAEDRLAQNSSALAVISKREEALLSDLAKLREEMLAERCKSAERALDIVERLLEVTDASIEQD